MDSLLKPTEVAERLSVSRAWVYDAAKVGRIPAIRIGGEDGPLRFVAEDLERWLNDARAAWTPGGRTIATRDAAVLAARPVRRRPRRRQPAAGQQSLV
jgi:excisionase family DNA binding protein